MIHNHFVGITWLVVTPLVGRMAGADRLLTSVHNDMGYHGRSRSRFVYDLYQHVLPVSDAVRIGLETGGVDPERLSTLYLGLFGERRRDADEGRNLRRTLGIPPSATVIGCIAFAAPFKGVDLLLRALGEIIASHENVYLLEIGVDEDSRLLRNLARDLGIADRVIWAGVVDEGWRLLSAADIYVQPSRSSEGLPLALMEAMALRLPIVCTRVSGNVEAVVDGVTGLVAEPDAHSLAEAIGRMLAHPEDWPRLGDAAWSRYRELFDGQASVDRLISEFYGIPRPTERAA